MKILIIEDNQEIIFGLEKLLNEATFTTYIAITLQKAKELLKKYEYNLIILDWILPDGSGVEFLAQLRKEYYTTTE